MKDKEKLQALRRGMTVAAAAFVSIQTSDNKAIANQPVVEKQPANKEVVMPDESKLKPMPNDTIAPFGVFTPDGDLQPVSTPVPEVAKIDSTATQTPPEEYRTEPLVPESAAGDVEYVDEATSFIENYETVSKAKKNGSMNKEDLADAKFDLYEEAFTINILQTMNTAYPLVKNIANSFEKIDSVVTVMQQYPQDSKEFKIAHQQLRPIAKDMQKNSKNSTKDLMKIANENKKLNKELSSISNSENTDEAFFNSKKTDNFINNMYRNAKKYVQEKAPEYFQEKKLEKAEEKAQKREERKDNRESSSFISKMIKEKSNSI